MSVWPPQQLALSELPFDLLERILSFLEPSDVVILRRVSRRMQHITLQKAIWINALRRYCKAAGLTTPVSVSQTITRHEVEHAATAPYRFASRLRSIKDQQRLLKPTSIRTLPHIGERASYIHVSLVPGGRYLVSVNHRWLIQIWDLHELSKGFPVIGELCLEGLKAIETGVASDGCIVLSTRVHGDLGVNEAVVYIHKINPENSPVKFVSVSSFLLNRPQKQALHATSGRIVFCTDADDGLASHVTVWNYELDTISNIGTTSLLKAVCLCDNLLVTWESSDEILFYNVPPPQSRSAHDGISSKLDPVFRFSPHLDDPVRSHLFCDVINRAVYVDVFGRSRERQRRIFGYKFDVKRPEYPDDDPVPSLPIREGESRDDTPLSDADATLFLTFLGKLPFETRFIMWLEDFLTVRLKARSEGRTALPSITLWLSGSGECVYPELFSFCMHSGRICVAPALEDVESRRGNEIKIVDYI